MSKKPILEAKDLKISFGRVEALRGADFQVYQGEVTALVGDNGAGKSTLIKALSGVHTPDSGSIVFKGQDVTGWDPEQMREMGLETVYQDLALAPTVSAIENLYLGREKMRQGLAGKFGFVDHKRMFDEGRDLFDSLSVRIPDLKQPVSKLSGGQQQGISVARAAAWAKEVIFLDEPTAALGVVQTRNVLDLILRIRDQGLGVVLISHSMPDVFAVADTIQVLRLGARVAQFKGKDTTNEEVVAAMTGALDFHPNPDADADVEIGELNDE